MASASGGPVMHLVCGLIGAGKSTYAKHLEEATGGVRFGLDEWMLRLHPGLSYASEGYGVRAEACKWVIWDVAVQFLRRDVDVILDWNQWSRQRRRTWRDTTASAGFTVRLHFLDVPLETALERSAKRSLDQTPDSHHVQPEDVRHLAEIFERPGADEGLLITEVQA